MLYWKTKTPRSDKAHNSNGRACRCENSSAYSLRRTPSAAYRVSNSQESVASPVDLAILEALVPHLNRRKKDSDYEEKFREDEEEVVKEFIQETEASL